MLKSHMASGHCTRQQNIEHFHHRRGSSGQRWILVSNNDEDLWLRGSWGLRFEMWQGPQSLFQESRGWKQGAGHRWAAKLTSWSQPDLPTAEWSGGAGRAFSRTSPRKRL